MSMAENRQFKSFQRFERLTDLARGAALGTSPGDVRLGVPVQTVDATLCNQSFRQQLSGKADRLAALNQTCKGWGFLPISARNGVSLQNCGEKTSS